MESAYVLALTTGLLGGTHCIGMCGPLVASYTLDSAGDRDGKIKAFRDIIPHLLYNTGRIMSYGFIGAFMGHAGSFINGISGIQSVTAMAAGAFMILMGANISGVFPGTAWLEKRNSIILKAGRELFHAESVWKYYVLGSLFGFLPCGLSYSVFVAAAATGNLVSGMMLALLFGLGTFPWLMLFGAGTSYLSAGIRGVLYRTSGIVVAGMGILFLIRGIRLYA